MADTTDQSGSVRQNLIDAGCDDELVARFFTLQTQGRRAEQLGLLSVHRRSLLDAMHATQRSLDCLDYLLYQMRRETAEHEVPRVSKPRR